MTTTCLLLLFLFFFTGALPSPRPLAGPVTLRYTASAPDTCQTHRCLRVLHVLMRTLYLFTRDSKGFSTSL